MKKIIKKESGKWKGYDIAGDEFKKRNVILYRP
jgi:hypothetical protein